MSDELYTILVSGEKLMFTKDQILSDPGNYFATYFFGEFAEGLQGTRELLVQKDIQLFRLIQAYLRGYNIFPMPDSAIPSYMTREVALTNLLLEAQFYGLEILEEKVRTFQLDQASNTSKKYKFAHFKDKKWFTNDISEDGYKTHLSRFINSSNFQPRTSRSLKCPGYKIAVCWRDNRVESPNSRVPTECRCALLVSDS